MATEIVEAGRPRPFELRGQMVLLASEVAAAFGAETRLVVQNIKNNPLKLPERYAFELTHGEVELLRSSGMISKAGRGGSRALPWVLTQKGVVRLATIMDSPKALEATDLIIDVFTDVLIQVSQGAQTITLQDPSRLAAIPTNAAALRKIRKQIAEAISDLLNTKVAKSGATLADEIGDIAEGAINHIKEFLRSRKITNEKIEAEAMLIIEQTRDMFERRHSDLAGAALDRERKALENFNARIAIVERLIAMSERLEPPSLVSLSSSFLGPARRLPPLNR